MDLIKDSPYNLLFRIDKFVFGQFIVHCVDNLAIIHYF